MRILLLVIFSFIYTFANVGVIVDSVGKSTLLRGKKTLKIYQKMILKKHDLITTGSDAKLKIFFKDDTVVSLGENTSFSVDNYFNKKDEKKTEEKNADEKSFIDDITINGQEYEELPQDVEFYEDDLLDGKVVIKGLLESLDKKTKVDDLQVEITTDGGEHWKKAKGHREWEWSFKPELEKAYDFSIRVVENSANNASENESSKPQINSSKKFNIAGFDLTLNTNASIANGKISGSGKLNIPYLDKISTLSNEIEVSFKNLSFSGNSITLGDIIYTKPISLSTPLADIDISKIIISATPSNNKIVGKVRFKGGLASTFDDIYLPSSSRLLPTSVSIDAPFTSRSIDIWREKGVSLYIPHGSFKFSYKMGDSSPQADLITPSVQFKLGDLLTYSNGNAAEVGLGDFGKTPTISLPKDVFLLDTGIKIPSGLNLVLNLTDLQNPKLSFSSSVDLKNFSNNFAKNLHNATLSATVDRTGMSATLSGDGKIGPVTILNRGSNDKSVRLLFEGENPTFTFSVANNAQPKISLNGVRPKISFGDLFSSATGESLHTITSLGSIKTPSLNISDTLYLLGSKIKLPNGFHGDVDLSDINNPVITFNVSVDLSQYDNIIAKQIHSANLKGTLSNNGFAATITAPKPNPISIYKPKGVKILFNKGISFDIHINSTESLPEFSISDIDAKLDFGTLLRDYNNEDKGIVADLTTITQNSVQSLALSLPAKVKLLNSKFAFEAIAANLNLQSKTISISSSADLSAYSNNPLLKALSGSRFDMSISPSGFDGSLSIDDELDPIAIWAEKGVYLNINGKPTVHLALKNGGLAFNFTRLRASIDFGSLLTAAQNSVKSIKAILSNSANKSGEYKIKLQKKAYLLGSKFALVNPEITLDPNKKEIGISSSVDLSQYDLPIIKAFNGAHFTASISQNSFSGTLSKESGFSPIVILNRGGVGKDVSLEFTSTASVDVQIQNSGITFGFNGGNAKLHFGDMLENATIALNSIKNGIYNWKLDRKVKLYKDANVYIQNIYNASLDLKNFKDPKISFSATVDLSEYGGILSNAKNATLKDATLSKDGFSGELSAHLGNIDIWKEKRVSLVFLSDPSIQLSILHSGLNIGFSNIQAKLNFGDLLDNATATIGDVMQSRSLMTMAKIARSGTKHSIHALGYRWSINRNNLALLGSNIRLSDLGGSLDLSDVTNPKITLNASADLRGYGEVFRYVRNADLQNVTISKHGFHGTLITSLNDIPIWREKNVKIVFDKTPTFTLYADNNGVKVSASDIRASVHLGSLLHNRIAKLNTLQDDIYTWSIKGKNRLADSNLYLSNLQGKINFSDLKTPVLNIKSAKIDGLDSKIKNVSLKNATISRAGFDAYLSAALNDIRLYNQDNKKIDLQFNHNQTPTLHLKLNNLGVKIGLSNFNAVLHFTNMLENQTITLTPLLENGANIDSAFAWNLEGKHNFYGESVVIKNINGALDLSDWSNPIATFHTTATFKNFNLLGSQLNGVFDVTRAEITKNSIKWNVSTKNARITKKILELGSGPNDDVRVELKNISGNVGSSGSSINGGDGTLYFGKLFSGNKHVGLNYSKSSGGLKTYTFAYSGDLVYKKDDNNFITLKNPTGSLVETSSGVFKVILNSSALAHSSLLNAINVGELSASNLEISSSGFAGDISANFHGISKSILGGKANVKLTKVGFHIDSSKSIPIALNILDGSLDLSGIFNTNNAKATLSLIKTQNGAPKLQWKLPDTTVVKLYNLFEFKKLKGNLDLGSLDEASLGFSGIFAYAGINKDIAFDNFTISAAGISGTIGWSGNYSIINNLALKNMNITFAGVNTSGSIALSYNNSSFLHTGKPLNLGLGAVVDKNGIGAFSVNGNTQSLAIKDFATFNFTSISASPKIDNFWIKLSGNIKPNNPLFNTKTSLSFQNLKISKSGISVDNAGIDRSVEGANASLAGLNMSVTKLGIGFKGNKFYIHTAGELSLKIVSAAGSVKLYSDKTVSVDNIAVKIHQSGLDAEGSLTWYNNDTVYGNGFKATLGMNIAKLFTADGLFRIGKKGKVFYWMANANVGGIQIPLSPIPLSIYKVGGGLAYHMIYNDGKKDFIPDGHTTSLMLNTTLGTSGDTGYLWNGDIKIIAGISDGTMGQLNLNGDSWLLANIGEKPSKRNIQANMTIGHGAFHMALSANIVFHGIVVKGKMDAMFSSSEKHVFIGSDDAYAYAFSGYKNLGHVTTSVFGIEGQGFFMVDTHAIAFGEGIYVYKHWSKDWWGPDPSLTFKLTAGAKALFVYRPFQMNIDAYANVYLRGCYGGCISVGADVLVKFATPHPDYIWGRASVTMFGEDITFSGYIRGSGALQSSSPKPDLKIFDRVDIARSVDGDASLIPYIEVYSKFYKTQNLIDIRVNDAKLVKVSSNQPIELISNDLTGKHKGKAYMPKTLLTKGAKYHFSAKMVASYDENGKHETKTKNIDVNFRTTEQDKLSFDEMVKDVLPKNGDTNVHEDTGVQIRYNRQIFNMIGGDASKYIKKYAIELYDADGNRIQGHFTHSNWDANSQTIISKFHPDKDLRSYIYCKDENGRVRETFVLNNEYLNPFNGYKADNDNKNIPVGNALNALNNQGSNGNIHNTNSVTGMNNSIVIPTYLKVGDITFHHPAEALGKFILARYNNGKLYSYYRANRYTIKVRDIDNGAVVHNARFYIRYNNIPAEAKRKVERMHENLDPTLTVSFDVNRLTQGGIYDQSEMVADHSFYNDVRVVVDDGLDAIGVYTGINTKVISKWKILTENGSTKWITKVGIPEVGGHKGWRLPGIVLEYNAKIEYYPESSNTKIFEKEMRLKSGEPFNQALEDEIHKDIAKSADKARQSASKVDMALPNGPHGGGGPVYDGGYGVEAGGFNANRQTNFNNAAVAGVGR